MNEASIKWQQKHRHIKEPTIEETMKRLRLKDEVSSKYEKTPKININLLKQRITRRLCQASGDNLINQVQSLLILGSKKGTKVDNSIYLLNLSAYAAIPARSDSSHWWLAPGLTNESH